MTDSFYKTAESSFTGSTVDGKAKEPSVVEFFDRGAVENCFRIEEFNGNAGQRPYGLECTPPEYGREHDRCDSWFNDARKLMAYENHREKLEKRRQLIDHCAEMLLNILFTFVVIILVYVSLFAIGKSIYVALHKGSETIPNWEFSENFNSSLTLGSSFLNFTARTYRLPLQLPEGKLKLQAPMAPQTDLFIAYSQIHGRLNVLSYTKHPNFNAYFVEHPDIQDVVMFSDELFCSPNKCFYIHDAHLLAHNTFKFINLTHRLAWVSLPSRHFRIAHFAEFLNAEFCSFRHTSSCPIVVNRGLHGVHKAAYIKKRGCCEISVEITGEILKSQTDITELQKYGLNNTISKFFRILSSSLTNNVLFDFNQEGHRSRVRIYGLYNNNGTHEYSMIDAVHINNTLSAITPLVDERLLEICHLTRSDIYCYSADLIRN